MASQPPPPYETSPADSKTPLLAGTANPVVTVQPVVVVSQTPVFRDYPVTITDSKGQQVDTILEYRIGLFTWIVAGVILLFTVSIGLCCLAIIPFFLKDLKDVYHISPTDGTVVGVYKRLD